MTDMAITPCRPFMKAGQHIAFHASIDKRPNGIGGPNPNKGLLPLPDMTSSAPQKKFISLAISNVVPDTIMTKYAAAIVDANPPRR